MSDQALKMQILALQKQVKELQALTKFIKVNGGQITIESSNLNIRASGVLNLNGSIIKLNDGGKPAARLGSKTAGNQASHIIIDGSPSVMMP